MTYEIFVSLLIHRIKNYLPDEWQDAEIRHIQVEKINYLKEAVEFARPQREGEKRVLAPNFSVYPFYEKFMQGANLEEVFREIADTVVYADMQASPIGDNLELDKMKENIIFELINTEQNKEFLERVPHREFEDLSIVYLWNISCNENGLATATVTNPLAEYMELNEEELFQLAWENTRRLFPVVIKPMHVIVDELMGNIKSEARPMLEIDKDESIHVITNSVRSKGAACILYEEDLFRFAEALGEDFYLLPSSRHEFLALGKEVMGIERLTEIVHEINQTEVELEDRLSNQIYQYNSKSRKVSLVSDSPFKRIDGRMSEADLAYEKQCREESRVRR